MSIVKVTWREHIPTMLKKDKNWRPDEPFVSVMDVEHAELLRGEQAAEALIKRHVEEYPESWNDDRYTIEIMAPAHLAGIYLVEVEVEIETTAHEMDGDTLDEELDDEPELKKLVEQVLREAA